MTTEYFPPESTDPEPVAEEPVVEPVVEPVLQDVSQVIQPEVPEVQAPVPVGPSPEEALAISNDPTTPSPFKPTPGVCGHCGNAIVVESQGHAYLCHACGKWSDNSGNPIDGNPHALANVSETFPWANVP